MRRVSIAGGMAVFDPVKHTDYDDVCREADADMYENKKRIKKASRNADLPKAQRDDLPEPLPAAVVEAEPEVDDGELIAVISAAVYSMYPSSSVRIKSVRKARSGASAWRSAGLSDNVRPF